MIFSDLPSPAEAGFAKAGNRHPLFGIMLWQLDRRSGQRGAGTVIDPAPSCVAPRQVPTRSRRQRVRNEVQPGCAPGMAAQQAGERHPAAGPQSKSFERLVSIVRAGRQVPAMKADQRRERVAIDFHQPAAGEAGGVAAACGDRQRLTPPRPWCRAWPRSDRSRRRRRQTSAAWKRGAPCSRGPAREPRYRSTCRRPVARRFP
jgi:hypothetical protein